MKTKKSKPQQIEMEKEIVHGYYYVPQAIEDLFIELAQPKQHETTLRIGFREVESKSSSVVDFVTQTIMTENVISERQRILDDKKFDVILCAPNFGLMLGENNRPSEELWLEWGIRHLKKDGRLVIVVPMGLLSNYSQAPIRQFLLEQAKLNAIVELPTGWASGVMISASILYITNSDKNLKSTRMLQLPRIQDLEISEICKLVRGDISKSLEIPGGKYFDVQRSELDYSRLDVKYYDPIYKTFSPSKEYASKILKDLVNIRSGDRFDSDKIENGGIPFIQVKNIIDGFGIDLRNTKKIRQDAAINSRSYCKGGDVLISIAGTIGKVAVVQDGIEVCIDTSLRQMRIRDESEILPEYLALFLRSDLAVKQMERMTSGSVINVLSTPNLENITIYLPSIEKQKEVINSYHIAVREAQSQLLGFFPNLDKRFSAKPSVEKIESIQEIKNEPFQLVVATKFPYPLARAYSLFINSSSEGGSTQVKRLFLASEAVVYYLYGILVSDYLKKHTANDLELNKLLRSSIYDFSVDKKIKFINKMIKTTNDDSSFGLFIPEIAEVAFNYCSEIHNKVRNNFSHNETSEPWCKKQVKDFSPKLDILFKSLLPIMGYRLVQATNIHVQNGRPQYNMIVMMGNNSIFTPQVEDLDSMLPIDTNKIILLDENYNSLDLHPIYQLHAWENTGMQDHLCFMKQITQGKNTLKLESLGGSGETEVDVDFQFINILTQLPSDNNQLETE